MTRFVPPSIALALFVLRPTLAQACGGTFCDNGTQMSVDQTGEDILFVREGDMVEAHVRIAYTGEAERFAWLVPLQAVPEIRVGSEPLFAALSQATAPNWIAQRSYECDEDSPGWGDDGGLSFIPASDFSGESDPEVVYEATVGSFDVIVLQGGTAGEVIDFLQANDYLQDPESEPILQEYLDEGFLFAAVKLTADVGVEAIHPLVFRMQADEFCVPIRLTRIAAEQDMGIRAYFLGQDRWVPSNYAHVVLDPLLYDWRAGSLDAYVELLALAVDEAGGRAFATDYAGSSEVVDTTNGVYSVFWDEAAFVDATPITAIDLIAEQGLNVHPLIQPLLLQFIPPPDGIDPQDFWNNIEAYADLIDQAAWDGPAFAAALADQIIDPGMHAADLIETWPKLTRLHTTMSPVEMTVDPIFHANPDLPDVAQLIVTQAQVLCGGDEVYAIALDGGVANVCVPGGASWPNIPGLPAALRVEQIPMAGPPQVVVDNTTDAMVLLTAQQATVTCESDMVGGEEDSGSTDTADTNDSGGSAATADAGDEAGESSGPGYDLPYDTSCGCASSRGEAPWAIGLGLLVLASIVPRRRAPYQARRSEPSR